MFKQIVICFICLQLVTVSLPLYANDISVYSLDTRKYYKEVILPRGKVLNLKLGADVSSSNNNSKASITYDSKIKYGDYLKARGGVFSSSPGGRFSKYGNLRLGTGYLILPDGQETYFFTRSTSYEAHHPPHASSNLERWGRLALRIAAGSSPVTFGIGFGASFLIGGLLSARKNGWKDFIWGGFDGAGLSVVESVARKQPDINFKKGQTIPFELTNDLTITRGLKKKKVSMIDLSDEELDNEINFLLSYGDLAGAIELANRSGKEEKLNELLHEVSN